jgi:hypothetical protein
VAESESRSRAVEHGAVAAEHDVARAARRGERRLGGDVRVAVAVPAHPGAEPQRHGEAQRVVLGRELVLVGAHERVVRLHARVEQPRLEVPEHGAHLVEHGGPVAAHLGGEPEQLHLAGERVLGGAPLGGALAAAAQEQVGDARLQGEQGAAGALGGVRGEHGAHLERADGPRHGVGVVPLLAQAAHRPARRRRLRRGVLGAEVGVAPPHAVHLLGGVDEQEEQRERARRVVARGAWETAPHAASSRLRDRRAGLVAPARAARRRRSVRRCGTPPSSRRRMTRPERGGGAAHVLVAREVLGGGRRPSSGESEVVMPEDRRGRARARAPRPDRSGA